MGYSSSLLSFSLFFSFIIIFFFFFVFLPETGIKDLVPEKNQDELQTGPIDSCKGQRDQTTTHSPAKQKGGGVGMLTLQLQSPETVLSRTGTVDKEAKMG